MPHTDAIQAPGVGATHGETGIEIDRLDVSETWKRRFKWSKKAGGPSLKDLKSMSSEDRFGLRLFGPFYYVAKGMWRMAISLLVVSFAVVLTLQFMLIALGLEEIARAL
ncbi:DUF2628 domain-containing protein, partial [Massilia sp. TS11]|uniref:DUF2628 domain-containing protein n=1 Tax=Massilia sp. TS11 TaxID=2908003 RepID=UPI001ED9EE43